jgi:hypothetical protein
MAGTSAGSLEISSAARLISLAIPQRGSRYRLTAPAHKLQLDQRLEIMAINKCAVDRATVFVVKRSMLFSIYISTHSGTGGV